MITKFNAVHALVGGQISGPTNGPISEYKFRDGQKPPTESAVNAKLKQLEAEFIANKYQRDRIYPNLGEQFDLLFKDINNGKVNKDGEFYKAIKAVKDANPKP